MPFSNLNLHEARPFGATALPALEVDHEPGLFISVGPRIHVDTSRGSTLFFIATRPAMSQSKSWSFMATNTSTIRVRPAAWQQPCCGPTTSTQPWAKRFQPNPVYPAEHSRHLTSVRRPCSQVFPESPLFSMVPPFFGQGLSIQPSEHYPPLPLDKRASIDPDR